MGVVRRLVLLVALASLVAGACGDGNTISESSPHGPPSTDRVVPAPDLPAGPGEVVVRVSSGGGMEPPPRFAEVPVISIYGDGTALVADGGQGAKDIARFGRSRIDIGELQQLIAEADHDGVLDEGVDRDQPNVTDLPTTVVGVVTADGRTDVSAYGLGYDDEVESDLPDRTREARVRLRRFVEDLHDLAGADSEPWAPDRYVVVAQPVAVGELDPDEDDPSPWPAGDLDAGTVTAAGRERCLVVTGADAVELHRLITSDQLSNSESWSSASGTIWEVWARPLLPDQPSCDPK